MADKAKLETAGKVTFSDGQVRDLIIEIEVCDHERHEQIPTERTRYRMLRKLSSQAAELGYTFEPAELRDAWDEPSLWLRFMLGVSANKIETIWRAAGGKGKAGWVDKKTGEWGGPVTELIIELFDQAPVGRNRRPSRSAIRDAMKLYSKIDSDKRAAITEQTRS